MEVTTGKCLFCGVDFMYRHRTKPRRFCSQVCGQRFRSGWKPFEASCLQCGKACVKVNGSGGRNRKFCSDDCRVRWSIEKRVLESAARRGVADCGWCCRPFTQRQFGQRFCSPRCVASLNNHMKLWGDQLSCAIPLCKCGRQILHNVGVARNRPPRASLCRECRTEAKRLHDAMRGPNKSRQRRAAMRAGERFTKLDVVQMWGSTCYLCGEEVSFDRSVASNRRASLDHVVPIFHGGSHTLQNCRIVHFGCNSAKGAKMILVGSDGR